MPRFWYAALALSLIGCAADGGTDTPGTGNTDSATTGGGDPCLPGSDPTLVIGTGDAEYLPLEDGDTVELVHGPQGGYHVLVALEATFIDAPVDELVQGHLTGTIAGTIVADTRPYLKFRCNPETGTLQSLGSLLVYDSTPEALDGKTTEIHAEVTDLQGAVITADRSVVIEDPLVAR